MNHHFQLIIQMNEFIPFNRIFKNHKEQEAAAFALSGDCWHGDGPIGKRVEEQLNSWLGSRYTLLTTSCTHALEMAMMVLEIGPGDEVIMPAFTFVSTANAVRLRGGTPVFAEIRDTDLTMDPEDVARKVTGATRAVIPIHYAGVSADFDGIRKALASSPSKGQKIAIVEDAAQAVGAWWRDRALGTVGDIGCFSFHDTKNITCGEGGAFLTQDDDLAEKAEWVREKGTNRSAFLRGEVDKYTWISPGSSYIPSDVLSSVLEVQLRKKEVILDSRKAVWNSYRERLQEAEDRGWIALPRIPSYARSNYHIFHFLVQRTSDRDPLIDVLRQEGIEATFHYIPLHNAPYARKNLGSDLSLPRTEKLAASLIRLPLYPDLINIRDDIADRVFSVLSQYFNAQGR